MPPNSIRRFSRLYLISLVMVFVQQVIALFFTQQMFGRFAAEMRVEGADIGSFNGLFIVVMVVGSAAALGLPLIFWWLAARKRQDFARWMLLAISLLSVLSWLVSLAAVTLMPSEVVEVPGFGSLQAYETAMVVVDAVGEALGIAALVYLFRPESAAWFRTVNPAASADVFR